MTVAYRPSIPRYRSKLLNDVFEVAIALRNPSDTFCKSDGGYYAAKNFADGRVVQIRRYANLSPSELISCTFSPLVFDDDDEEEDEIKVYELRSTGIIPGLESWPFPRMPENLAVDIEVAQPGVGDDEIKDVPF
jgi:hypothetical protein